MPIDYVAERDSMVALHLEAHGISDKRVLSAMRTVPREKFLQRSLREQAYCNKPLGIADGQTISQPYIVALMTQALEIGPDDTVLEIGAGSGYAAAVLSLLCKKVYSIERIRSLAEQAEKTLQQLDYNNVEVICGDGTLGWPSAAPYNGIIVSAGGPKVPESLKNQLAPKGRLVMPVRSSNADQVLVVVQRMNETEFQQSSLGAVRFVPLIGAEGWSSENLSSTQTITQ